MLRASILGTAQMVSSARRLRVAISHAPGFLGNAAEGQ